MSYIKNIDKGILEFLKSAFDLDQVIYSHSDTALRKRATDLTSGRSVLPFISFIALGIERHDDRRNQTMWHRGDTSVYMDEDTKADILMCKLLPVNIKYQIDLWSNNREEMQERIYLFEWYMLDLPVVYVDMSEFKFSQRYHFFIDPGQENTDLGKEFEEGRLYRISYTATLQTEIPREEWIKTYLTLGMEYIIVPSDEEIP